MPCIFPFIIKNVTYDECTRNHDKFGRLWCSTKVDKEGMHVSDNDENWGYCSQGIDPIVCILVIATIGNCDYFRFIYFC